MDSVSGHTVTRGVVFRERLQGARTALALAAPLLLIGSIAFARAASPAGLPMPGLGVGAQDAAPAALAAAAGDFLEARTGAGGGGYRFQIVQTSTMVARADGPRIAIPDPITRGTLRMADTYFLNSVIEQGVVRPDGFWSQLRAGPTEGNAPDWVGAHVMYEALVRDGARWRSDGDGWYRADALPGIGLDPETAAMLPDLLRGSTTAKDLPPGDDKIDPAAARTLEAAAQPADIPGLVASDGLTFTELRGPLVYGFDAGGRLISITAVARNTNMTEHDLIVEMTITIAYDAVGALPEPTPARAAEGAE